MSIHSSLPFSPVLFSFKRGQISFRGGLGLTNHALLVSETDNAESLAAISLIGKQ
jgi:hypothetical protein